MRRTLHEAARALGHALVGDDRPFEAVSTDTRTLPAGALFVALRGPNFDGADFAAAALARGAVGAIVERALTDVALPYIRVPDTLEALQLLARRWREEFSIPLVGIGGSNGKTTTKEMTAAILSRRGPCLSTQGNLNNHIGVPLTLLGLASSHRGAVITNAGAEHLEGFGDLDGVARGEGEMVAGLEPGAAAVINADDAYAEYWRGLAARSRIVTFGVRGDADFKAQEIVQSIEGGRFATRFTLECPLGRSAIALQAGGAHNISNALGAAAAAASAGASLENIAAGLADFRAVAGRLQLKVGLRDSWIIDDSYNANPSSVRAGLDVLRTLPGPAWLVLADMAELGAHASDSHAALGRYARECGVARLFALGPESTRAVETFGSGGEWFADAGSLTRRLQGEIAPGVTVLVKGSRVNRLERVVQALLGGAASSGPMMRAS